MNTWREFVLHLLNHNTRRGPNLYQVVCALHYLSTFPEHDEIFVNYTGYFVFGWHISTPDSIMIVTGMGTGIRRVIINADIEDTLVRWGVER